MEIQLLDLPQVCLEEVLKKLRFQDISRVGATCKYFREIAKTIFRLYFKSIEEIIEGEMEKIEADANKPESLTISEHLHLALLHSVRFSRSLWAAFLELPELWCCLMLLAPNTLQKVGGVDNNHNLVPGFQTLISGRNLPYLLPLTPHSSHTPFQVLRILLSEAKMLKAHCWRYMREPSYDFCFPAGLILDEFDRILRSVRNRTLKKDMEPEITTTLFHLGEAFYDYFDFHIETGFQESSRLQLKITSDTDRQTFLPNIYNFVSNVTRETFLRDVQRYTKKLRGGGGWRTTTTTMPGRELLQQGNYEEGREETSDQDFGFNEKTLFGVKILDILNCCALSNFHTLLSHSSGKEGFKLQTHYELRDINVLEALPTIGLSMATSEKQLSKICRYIRNNVRWTNLFHPLQDLWMLEDAIEVNRNIETASALLRQWKLQRSSSRLNFNNAENHILQLDHRKIISRFKNRFGLLVAANLECPTLQNVPLKLDKCLGSKNFVWGESENLPKCNFDCGISLDEFDNKNKIHLTDFEKWNCNKTTYKFHLELKIQYPSFLSETVREAILKVDQIGEKTMVSTDGDDIRKSGTYRADECCE